MPDFLQPLIGAHTRADLIFYATAGSVGLLLLIVLWQVFAPGPRRRRGLKRVRRRLAAGAWPEALARVTRLRKIGFPSAGWKKRLSAAEADCLGAAAKEALAAKKFEEALGFLVRKAEALGEPEMGAMVAVQSAMLEEIRRLFSITNLGDNRPVHELITGTLQVQSPCREASFWQGLAYLRGMDSERGLRSLQTARGEARSTAAGTAAGDAAIPRDSVVNITHVDPSLYLGALLLRQGQAKESLKYLTEANRLDGNCPMVTLQLGAAMIAAGGDTQLAVRALQRALGPKGLGMWADEPRKAWVEGFPEGRSYVRKLAAAYPFVCPIWGGDLNLLMQQGNLALAQGLYKLGVYSEAAELFAKVLQYGAPSLTVLRGLGLALARLGKYDEAFKHLRIAHDMEEPKDRITTGYLALCGAKGKPTQPEDKAKNITWALKMVVQFNAPGDREWVALIGSLFAEAREERLALSPDDQLYLCEHLLSTLETDPQAAQAFHHLQSTYPKLMRDEYAWLYCRAVQQHKVEGADALPLFARTFATEQAARAFFERQHWDFDAVEYAYLERAAALDPGHFPEALGEHYARRGAALLLERARHQEEAGQLDQARQTVAILQQLDPANSDALDRLAFLHHCQGQSEQAVQFLEAWNREHPTDPRPLVRFAIFLHQRGHYADSQAKLREALELCSGGRKARIAFLGARLALQKAFAQANAENAPGLQGNTLQIAQEFLLLCLREDPGHIEAQWCLAGVRWLRGDVAGLAEQAEALNQPDITTSVKYHFFRALCRLAARDFAGVLEVCGRVAAMPQPTPPAVSANGSPAAPRLLWPAEAAFLAGLAYLGLGQNIEAANALQKVAMVRESPSAALAQALLGAIDFAASRYEEAGKWWQMLDPRKRSSWKLGETLAGTVFLTALEAYSRASFEEAADKLRSAGKLGCRDRRLGSLLVLSLFKAGQSLVYGGAK